MDPFIIAIQNNNLAEVLDFLELGYDPASNGNTAIITAAGNRRLEIAQVLLQDPRTDPSALQNRSLDFAVENGDF